MNLIKKLAASTVLVAVGLSLAGCPAEPGSSGASGVVVKREQKEARNSPRIYYVITIKETSGKKDTGEVSKAVYKSCAVGDPWPACKKAAK